MVRIRRVNRRFLKTTTKLYKNIFKYQLTDVTESDLDVMLFRAEEQRTKTIRRLKEYLSDFLNHDFMRICDSCIGKKKSFAISYNPFLKEFTKYITSNGYSRQLIFKTIPELKTFRIKNFFSVKNVFMEDLKGSLPLRRTPREDEGSATLILNRGECLRFAKAMQADINHEGFFDKNLMYERIVDIVCVLTFLEELYG